MIVCICFNVSEKAIKARLPCHIEDIMLETGCGTCCGTCIKHLEKIMSATEVKGLSAYEPPFYAPLSPC